MSVASPVREMGDKNRPDSQLSASGQMPISSRSTPSEYRSCVGSNLSGRRLSSVRMKIQRLLEIGYAFIRAISSGSRDIKSAEGLEYSKPNKYGLEMSIAEAYQLAYLIALRKMTQTQVYNSKRTWEENAEMLRPLR